MHLFIDSFYYHCTIHQSNPHLPYLLMLHGFLGSGKVFDHLMDKLNSFCNPITIDLAGHGQTDSPDDPKFYTAQRQVQQVHSVIQRLQFDDMHLYGYSMGGRLAFQLMASHPDLLSGVIIESSHCGIDSKAERSDRQAVDEKRAQQIEKNFGKFIEDWMKLPLLQHTPKRMKSMYEKVMKAQKPKQISASLRGFGAGVMPSVCDKIKDSKLSLTLITGELDQKYVERMTEINKQVNSSNLEIVTNAGHRVHADQPEELIQILKNAMAR
jgi:2-succinyl-6-hydroxy-2,4-cyclohexadiene-1-carboxylate synthase